MQFISIGCDCHTAMHLKRKNVREISNPFDWVVTYNGVSGIIKSGFKDYFPKHSAGPVVHNGVLWVHHTFPKDADTIKRRCDRFMRLLGDTNNKRNIVFIRKGHHRWHHEDCANRGIDAPRNDIEDAVELDAYLVRHYPLLKFSIHVVAACTVCFDESVDRQRPVSENVVVHFVKHGTSTSFGNKCNEIIQSCISSRKVVAIQKNRTSSITEVHLSEADAL